LLPSGGLGPPVAAAGGAPVYLPPAAVGDAAELLDVYVHQVAGVRPFVAAHWLFADRLAGGQVQGGQLGHLEAHQDPVHGRGVHTQSAGDGGWTEAAGAAQVRHLAFDPHRGAGLRWGQLDRSTIPTGPSCR
jgi:hypothetical protein